jgi:hypothetical protein
VTSAKVRKRNPKDDETRKDRFEDAISDIALGACLVVLPMIILSGVFIGLVFGWRVVVPVDTPSDKFSNSLSLVNNSQSMHSAFFVDIDSARLVTVASWTSTVIPFLLPWLMLLYSYHLAARFLSQDPNKLPTPFQLRLLIELCTGALGSLWNVFTYRTAHRDRKRGNSMVAMTASIFLVCTVLSLCILLADTWLHLTTTTVLLLQTAPSPGNPLQLSRALSPECQQGNSYCTINAPTFGVNGGQIINASSAYKTLFDVSPDIKVLSTTVDGQIYSFYASSDIPSNLTYRASTFGLNT